jgi:hypothetical protein
MAETGRKSAVPNSLISERKEYTIMMKTAGMSVSTIVKQVNAEAVTRGWGTVSRRTIERDIADYYRKNRVLTVQDYDHADQMREAFVAQMEVNMEKLAIHIATKNKGKILYDSSGVSVQISDWKPFEYADALDKIHRMQMNYAEIQNWNKGRQNININFQQNNINAIFDSATAELESTKPAVVLGLIAEIEKVRDKLKEEEDSA